MAMSLGTNADVVRKGSLYSLFNQENIDLLAFFSTEKYAYLIFLILHKNMSCYSSEVPHLGVSNEYPQSLFSWGN